MSSVDPVEFVADTLRVEFSDDTNGLLSDGSFGLLGAGSAMMSAVDARMLGDRVLELSCLHCGLPVVNVCANPEVWACLKLSK